MVSHVEHVEHDKRAENGVQAVMSQGQAKAYRVGPQYVRHGNVHLDQLAGNSNPFLPTSQPLPNLPNPLFATFGCASGQMLKKHVLACQGSYLSFCSICIEIP